MEASRIGRLYKNWNNALIMYAKKNKTNILRDLHTAVVVDGVRDGFVLLPAHGYFIQELLIGLALAQARNGQGPSTLDLIQDILDSPEP